MSTQQHTLATPRRAELVIVSAECRPAVIDSNHGTDNPYTVDHQTALKNGQLMAAAPKLLRAALMVVHELNTHHGKDCRCKTCKAVAEAIAAATADI